MLCRNLTERFKLASGEAKIKCFYNVENNAFALHSTIGTGLEKSLWDVNNLLKTDTLWWAPGLILESNPLSLDWQEQEI